MTTFLGRVYLGLALGLAFFQAQAQIQLPSPRQLAPVAGSWKIVAAWPSQKGFYITGHLADKRLLIGECDIKGNWNWWKTWGHANDSLRVSSLVAISPETICVAGQHHSQATVWYWKRKTGNWQVTEYSLGKGMAQSIAFSTKNQIVCAIKDQTRIQLMSLLESGKRDWTVTLTQPSNKPTDQIRLLMTRKKFIGLTSGNKLWVLNERGRLVNTQQADSSLSIQSLTESPLGNIIGVGSVEQNLLYPDNRDIEFRSWSPDGKRFIQNHLFGDEQLPEVPLTVSQLPGRNLLILSKTGENLREDIVTKNGDYHLHYLLAAPKGTIVQTLPLAPWQGNFMLFLNYNGQVLLQPTRSYIDNQPDSIAHQPDQLRVLVDIYQAKNQLAIQAQDDQPLRYKVQFRPNQTLAFQFNKQSGTGYAFLFSRTNAKSAWQDQGWIHLDSLNSLIGPTTKKTYELLLIVSASPSASPLQKLAPLVYQLKPNLSLDSTLCYTSILELAEWHKLPANERLNLQTSLDGRTITCGSFRGEAWFPIVIEVR